MIQLDHFKRAFDLKIWKLLTEQDFVNSLQAYLYRKQVEALNDFSITCFLRYIVHLKSLRYENIEFSS